MKNKILFLCTGNYYRSKFSEIYFNFLAQQQHLNWQAFSRGFFIANPENVGWISPFALKKLQELQVPIPVERLPERVTKEELKEATLIIALHEREHRPFIKQLFPDWENKIVYWNIFDRHDVAPEQALTELQGKIEELLLTLNMLA